MASLPGDHQFQSSLRSPARDAYDSRSCAITRGSVPNDMVAFGSQHGSAGPGLVQQRFATIQYPGTKELLVPRDGVTPGWNEEFINLIAQHKRSHILREEPPTLQHFIQAAPSIDLRLLQHMHSTAVKEWQQENTDVFYILRNSVNLAGPHNKTDLAMIEQNFCFNDLRDGKGFLEFVTGFKPEGSVRIQASYLRALDTKLSASATLTQVQVHCDALLCTWQKIRGNSIDHPEAFYHYLLESFPLEPESGKIPRLRGWIAEQITEESPTLVQPTVFLAKVALHGQLLRIPDSGESIHITTNGDRRQNGRQQQTTHTAFQFVNDCDSCDAKCCSSRKKGGKKFCVCKNAQVPLPDDASYGMKQFVSLNRAYTLLHPTADLTKTSVEQMRAAVRKSKKEKEKVAPAVLPVGLQAGEVPNLSGDQMQLFRQWLAESAQQVTMVAESDYLPDPVHAAGFLSLLALCTHCGVQHTPQSPWCPLSLGMPERCPSPGPGGCGRSHCERSCSCDMRGWVKEMNYRLGARVDLYNGQVELQLTLDTHGCT